MIKKVFCIYDSISEVYMPPFCEINTQSAIRMIKDAHKNPNSGIGEHADDLVLYELGAYSDTTAEFNFYSEPKRINKLTHIVNEIVFNEKTHGEDKS